MSLKISQILNEIILTEEDGSVFTDYVPVYILNIPTKVKFKLSTAGEDELEGTIQLLESEHQKLIDGKPLNYYTFEIVVDDEKRTIQLYGKEVNKDGSPSLYKNVPYNFIFGEDLIKGEEESNFYNGPDIDDVNKELYDLKTESETFKVISKYKDDPEFQKILLDSFISGTKSIKMNQKPITDTLRDLRKNGLLEAKNGEGEWMAPEMSGRKRNYLKLKLGLQNFVNKLFKLFAKLHKSGKNSITYKVIKKFYKQLFFIITKGQANISDQKTRNKLWKDLLGNFSDLLKGISKSKEFVRGKGRSRQNENFILEAVRKEQIIFTDFDINNQQIEDSVEDMDVDDMTPDETQKMNDLAFLLYGKDAGRLLPRYSRKFPGIKSLFGLFKKGGYETSLEKSKEKWGVSRFDFKGGEEDIRSMKNLPMFNVEFETPLNYDDGEGNRLKILKGDVLKFNYDSKNKVLIHKISQKIKTNINQIYLKMDNTPELGKTYNTRLTKIVPKGGQIFDVETTKGYGAKIKIIEPTKK